MDMLFWLSWLILIISLQAQVKKMQEQASLKAAFSPDGLLDDLKNKVHELEKENKYLAVSLELVS